MNDFMVMGIFAFLVVGISLGRLLAEKEFFRVAALKRVWGRSRGLALFFLLYIGVPLVVGIVFFSKGISHYQPNLHGFFASSRNQARLVQAFSAALEERQEQLEVVRSESKVFHDEFGHFALPMP